MTTDWSNSMSRCAAIRRDYATTCGLTPAAERLFCDFDCRGVRRATSGRRSRDSNTGHRRTGHPIGGVSRLSRFHGFGRFHSKLTPLSFALRSSRRTTFASCISVTRTSRFSTSTPRPGAPPANAAVFSPTTQSEPSATRLPTPTGDTTKISAACIFGRERAATRMSRSAIFDVSQLELGFWQALARCVSYVAFSYATNAA